MGERAMPEAASPICVVICSHADERFASLGEAISSVLGRGEPPCEVVVVIDHNPALLARASAAYPAARVIENAHGRGLSGARNSGIDAAQGDIVAFLDDDAEADDDWLACMARPYADPSIVGVGGLVTPIWPADAPRWLPREFYWVVGCSYLGLPDDPRPIRNPIGCNMSFRRDVLQRLGGFREGIGRQATGAAGCEETELGIRATQGAPPATILYDPAVKMRHHIAPDRTTWRYYFRRCLDEGRSKALVVNSVGTEAGLSSERNYVLRTLPRGVLRGLGDAAFRLDGSGLARAFAICAGLACVTTAYLFATLLAKWRRRGAQDDPPAEIFPVKILEVDMADPLPDVDMRRAPGLAPFRSVLCLVRRGGHPLKIAEFAFQGTVLSAERLAGLIGPQPADLEVDRPAASLSAPGAPPLVSIIVATHDRAQSLALSLDSLLKQDYPNVEIVVVDNAPSSAATAELIAARYAPTGRIVYAREDTPGLGRAHNKGLEIAKGGIVAFTDDDTIADRRWVSAIEAAFRRDALVGCVCGLILPVELETKAQYWTEKHGGFGKGLVRKTFDLNAHRLPGPLFPYTPGEYGSGANMAFSAQALRRIGGFDSALGAGTIARGGDDLAAFVGVIKAGYRLVYEPGAVIWHLHRREESGIRGQAYGYGVGLGAFLTKQIVDQPSAIIHFARAFPAAVRHVFGSRSPKNQRLPADYPQSLVWRERAGVVAGVAAYLRSRAAAARAGSLSGSRLEAGR